MPGDNDTHLLLRHLVWDSESKLNEECLGDSRVASSGRYGRTFLTFKG